MLGPERESKSGGRAVIRKPVVLITGASGEIGHGLIERLAQDGQPADRHARPEAARAEAGGARPAAVRGLDPRRPPARADPGRVRGRAGVPPRGAPVDARRVHADDGAPGQRRGHAAPARVRAEGGRVARAARSCSSTRARSPPTGCPTSQTKARAGRVAEDLWNAPDHDVRLQQALLRASRPLLLAATTSSSRPRTWRARSTSGACASRA